MKKKTQRAMRKLAEAMLHICKALNEIKHELQEREDKNTVRVAEVHNMFLRTGETLAEMKEELKALRKHK